MIMQGNILRITEAKVITMKKKKTELQLKKEREIQFIFYFSIKKQKLPHNALIFRR